MLDTLLNPTVIIEVLSPSTEAYDRGDKFAHYRRAKIADGLRVRCKNKVRVEHFTRSNDRSGEWIFTEVSDQDGTLRLASIGCEMALRDIYDKIKFPNNEDATNPEGLASPIP